MDAIEVVVHVPPEEEVGATTSMSDGCPLLENNNNNNISNKRRGGNKNDGGDDTTTTSTTTVKVCSSNTTSTVVTTKTTSTDDTRSSTTIVIIEQTEKLKQPRYDDNTSSNDAAFMTTTTTNNCNNNDDTNSITCRMTDEGIETIEVFDDPTKITMKTEKLHGSQRNNNNNNKNELLDGEQIIPTVSTSRNLKPRTTPTIIAQPPQAPTTLRKPSPTTELSSSDDTINKKLFRNSIGGSNNNNNHTTKVDGKNPPTTGSLSSLSSTTTTKIQNQTIPCQDDEEEESTNQKSYIISDPNDVERTNNTDTESDRMMMVDKEIPHDTKMKSNFQATATATSSGNDDSIRRNNRNGNKTGILVGKKPALKNGIFNQSSLDTYFSKNRMDGTTDNPTTRNSTSASAAIISGHKPHPKVTASTRSSDASEPQFQMRPRRHNSFNNNTTKIPVQTTTKEIDTVARRFHSRSNDESTYKEDRRDKSGTNHDRLRNDDDDEEKMEEDIDKGETQEEQDEEYDPTDWGLPIIRSYERSNGPTIHIAHGSVLDFRSRTGAIVNAANEECLFGGGVDGAITAAGGRKLALARLALPILNRVPVQNVVDDDDDNSDDEEEDDESINKIFNNKKSNNTNATSDGDNDDCGGDSKNKKIKTSVGRRPKEREVRCLTGDAVLTGPNKFGSIRVPYVIHAVGPNYWDVPTEDGHNLLFSAYQRTMDLTATVNYDTRNINNNSNDGIRNPIPPIQHIAFCLLSAGIFRAKVPLALILDIGINAILRWKPPRMTSPERVLRDVILCGFTRQECSLLIRICDHHLVRPDRPKTRSMWGP